MSEDYFECDYCHCRFPYYSPFRGCSKDHILCEQCGDEVEDVIENEHGYISPEVCPVCKAGGTKLEQIQTLCEDALLADNDIDILHSAVQKILKLVTGANG